MTPLLVSALLRLGHVGPDSLPELARITRANGVVIFTVN